MQPARYGDRRILGPMNAGLARDLPPPTTPRNVYVSRADARGRHIVNEAELMPELEKRGFERVTMAGRPPADRRAVKNVPS